MELERELDDLQSRLRSSQHTEGAVSLSQEQLSHLKAQAQSQERKVREWGGVSLRQPQYEPEA